MSFLRKRTAWIAAAWLTCHALALTAPLAAVVIAAAEDLCTCPGGTPGAVCPMHHRVMTPDAKPAGPQVRNGCAQPDTALLSLTGGLGVLPVSAVQSSLALLPATVASVAIASIQHVAIPDAPPPRA